MSNKKRAKGGGAYRRRRPASSTAARKSSTPAIETPAVPAAPAAPAAPVARRRTSPPTRGSHAGASAPTTLAEEPVVVAPAPETAPEEPVAEEAPAAPPLDPAPSSGSRIRRTRTLADVVQPEYLAAPEGEGPAAPAEPERRVERATPSSLPRIPASTAPLAGVTVPPRAAPFGPLGAAPSGPLPVAPTTLPPVRPPASSAHPDADDPLRTVPFGRRPIPRPARGPLSGPHGGAQVAAETAPTSAMPAEAGAPVPLATRLLWSIQRGNSRLVLTAALGHVCVGMGLAVATAIVFLVSAEQGYRLLIIAAIIIGSGIAGYALVTNDRPTWAGALVLVLAQLATLALFFGAFGAQIAALLFAPAAAYLAQRMGGRVVAIVSGAGAVIVYLAFVIAGLIWPAPVIHPTALLFFNLFAAVAGTGLLLISLLIAATARERSEAAARARLYELRLLRARAAEARELTERDARALEEALAIALRGRGIEPVSAEGALSPIAELTTDVAERLMTLQKDREDRLRLEGGVRAVLRAVERGWHGLPWAWPEPSGTMLDQLIAYLRTPRPREQGTPLPWGDETPTIVPRPARGANSRPLVEPRAGTNSRPLEPPSNPDIARVFSAVDEQWDPWSDR